MIRIGSAQTATYLAGVFDPFNPGTFQVTVAPSGKLSTLNPSSRRFKEDIRDLGDDSRAILELRPVVFRLQGRARRRATEAEADRPLQSGLIAEEVAEVLPSLVQNGPDGQPIGVRYQALVPLLLNESAAAGARDRCAARASGHRSSPSGNRRVTAGKPARTTAPSLKLEPSSGRNRGASEPVGSNSAQRRWSSPATPAPARASGSVIAPRPASA